MKYTTMIYRVKEWGVASFATPKEFIDNISYHRDSIEEKIKENPTFCCVDSIEDLDTRMKYDTELMDIYKKVRGNVVFSKTKMTVKEKQYRDSGTCFDYPRYLDGRQCIYRKVPREIMGSSRSKTISIVVNIGENFGATKQDMMYKTEAVIEMCKTLQAAGRNVELHVIDLIYFPFRNTRCNLCHHIIIKRGDEPLIVPKVVSILSPYFMRCYMVAGVRTLDYRYEPKYWPRLQNKKFTNSMGMAIKIEQLGTDFCKKLFAFCGIAEDTVVIDKGLLDEWSLRNFRKKNNITIF